jgi:hypothetical protein
MTAGSAPYRDQVEGVVFPCLTGSRRAMCQPSCDTVRMIRSRADLENLTEPPGHESPPIPGASEGVGDGRSEREELMPTRFSRDSHGVAVAERPVGTDDRTQWPGRT